MSDNMLDGTADDGLDHDDGVLRQWSQKYGSKHRLIRVTEFPSGIIPPKKVRIYHRCDHFLLQWWDTKQKTNLSYRVNGDLVSAISRAREIEERLKHFKASGMGWQRIRHHELVELYIADLNIRVEASEIDGRMVRRYESALGHYLAFVKLLTIEKQFPSATNVDRNFAMKFVAYLVNKQISPNGHVNSKRRRMVSSRFVEDVVRSMFNWAAASDKGNLMPAGFHNSFSGTSRRAQEAPRDLFGEPDITTEMATEFILKCDTFQLPLFSVLIFYGLRASEPCFAFRDELKDGWLVLRCLPELSYRTKGRRNKRLPIIDCIAPLLQPTVTDSTKGLLFVRRSVMENREIPKLLRASLKELEQVFSERCACSPGQTLKARETNRDKLLEDAGGLKYDHIQHEFSRLARRLNWPATATLKDFRHLFSTEMQNGGMPEFYRRYLLGHSPGKAAVVNYTHLNRLRERYEEAVSRQFQPLVEAVVHQSQELGLLDDNSKTTTPEINENDK